MGTNGTHTNVRGGVSGHIVGEVDLEDDISHYKQGGCRKLDSMMLSMGSKGGEE